MAYELLDRPLIWIPVVWKGLVAGPDDGVAVPVEHEIDVLVELVDKEQVRKTFGLSDDGANVVEDRNEFETFKALASSWRKIMARGSPVPFNDDNIRKVVSLPNFFQAFTIAYMMAVVGQLVTREGNSESSQPGGRADEASAGTATGATKP